MPPLAIEVHSALTLRWDSCASTESAGELSSAMKPLTSRRRSSKSSKKSVSFSDRVKVRKCLHASSYTSQEKKATWYDKIEFESIRDDIDMAVYFISTGMLEMGDTDQYCKRGLECRTPDGMESKTLHKLEAWKVVLEEQEKNIKRRKNNNKKNILLSPISFTPTTTEQERISRVYKSISKKCADKALQIAKEDAIEASQQS